VTTTSRRSTDVVRRLILDAATDLFSERGVARTGMRDIARQAGVAEPLLYRHFGSKENLFREAVFTPVRQFFSDYTDAWRSSLEHEGPAPGSGTYMSGLYDALRANRGLLLTLLASDVRKRIADDPSAPLPKNSPLVALLSEIEDLVTLEQGRSLRASLDPALAVRFTFSLCLSMALFGDLMFPVDGPHPEHDVLVAEMGAYLTYATVREAGRGRNAATVGIKPAPGVT
jgi:AcrR family transcriptional regulator